MEYRLKNVLEQLVGPFENDAERNEAVETIRTVIERMERDGHADWSPDMIARALVDAMKIQHTFDAG
jgi:hypothetical protein